jgi:hypothetical protein
MIGVLEIIHEYHINDVLYYLDGGLIAGLIACVVGAIAVTAMVIAAIILYACTCKSQNLKIFLYA